MEWRSRLASVPAGEPVGDVMELGHVSGVFGVRGEVRLHLHNRESELLRDGLDVHLVCDDGTRLAARLSTRPGAGGRVLGRIDGIDRREWAEAMRGVRIEVPFGVLPEPEDGEYYLDEVIGMEVVCEGVVVGRIAAVHTTGPVEVFELESGDYLPSTGEHVLGIDRIARRIEVAPGAVHAV